jgi:hypothetical protein
LNAPYWKKLMVGALLLLGALFVINGLAFDAPDAEDQLLLMLGLTLGMVVLVLLLGVQTLRQRDPKLEPINPVSDEMVSAMFLAREETEASGQAAITDLHLLRGLLRTRGSTAEVALTRAGVSLDQLPEPEPQPAGTSSDALTGQVPLSVNAQICLRIAGDEARNLGDSQVRTGHVLLALMRPDVSVAAAILGRAGLDRDSVLAYMLAANH